MARLGLSVELRAPRHPDVGPVAASLPPSRGRWLTERERRQRRPEPAEIEQARQKCTVLVGEHGPRLAERFWQVVERARDDRRGVWRARDVRLAPDWFKSPWFFAHLGDDASRSELRDGLQYVARLGFRNLAYAHRGLCRPEDGPDFEILLRQADRLGVRISTGLDLTPLSPLMVPATPARPSVEGVELYASLFELVAQELNRGVAGLRLSRIDCWALGVEPRRRQACAHALAGLVKLMIRRVAPRDVLIPEARGERSGMDFARPTRWSGPHIVGAEGDAYTWNAASRALSASLQRRDTTPLRQTLKAVPDAGPHAARWVALDPDRLPIRDDGEVGPCTALGLLYAVPAIPVVHDRDLAAATQNGETPAHLARMVRRLNGLRSKPMTEVRTLDAPDRGHLHLWTSQFEFRANLTRQPWSLVVSERLWVGWKTERPDRRSLRIGAGGWAFTTPGRPAESLE